MFAGGALAHGAPARAGLLAHGAGGLFAWCAGRVPVVYMFAPVRACAGAVRRCAGCVPACRLCCAGCVPVVRMRAHGARACGGGRGGAIRVRLRVCDSRIYMNTITKRIKNESCSETISG